MSAAPSATEQRKRGSKASPSGRLLLRMPAALHAELARWAEREGVSLNQFITRSLESRIGWGTEDGTEGLPARTAAGRANLIAVALVANAVVIGLAAIAAIAVLVLAWRG